VVIHHAHELLQGQQGITEQAVADRRGSSQRWIGRDLQQFGARGQVLAGHIRVLPENLRPDHDDKVVTPQDLRDSAGFSQSSSGIDR
jgi:hypothetical protein